MSRIVFIDRDGTINVEKHYISSPEQIELLPFSSQGIKLLHKMGLKVACYTTTTGTDRLITARRLPNGWKELDDTSSNFPTVYDEFRNCPKYF